MRPPRPPCGQGLCRLPPPQVKRRGSLTRRGRPKTIIHEAVYSSFLPVQGLACRGQLTAREGGFWETTPSHCGTSGTPNLIATQWSSYGLRQRRGLSILVAQWFRLVTVDYKNNSWPLASLLLILRALLLGPGVLDARSLRPGKPPASSPWSTYQGGPKMC